MFMGSPLKVAGAFFVAAAIITVATLSMSPTSHALSDPNMQPAVEAQLVPLEVVPVCSDQTAMISRWKVTNKNDTDVVVVWNNFENGTSGTYTAPARTAGTVASETELVTNYNPADPNNTTRFTYNGMELGQTNAQVSACAPVVEEPVECIDGRIQQNLTYEYETDRAAGYSAVYVKTVNDMPLCDDIDLFFSSYTMPDNYDGNGFFGNPTAFPQHVFSSVGLTLEKGSNAGSVFLIELPDLCKNVQTDLYYGPEITTVGPEGHGTQNIDSQVYLAEGKCDEGGNGGVTPPVEPPVTPTTPEVTTPEVVTPGRGEAGAETTPVVAAEMPTMLPETGTVNPFMGLVYAAILGFLTYLGLYALLPRKQS